MTGGVALTGGLHIVTTPDDVIVKINGVEVGKTPLTIKNQLVGEYSLELSLAGYTTVAEKVTIREDQVAELNKTLVNGMSVVINGNPAGADLFIDNIPAGRIPHTCVLTFGIHRLRLEKDGRKDEQQVEVTPGGKTEFFLSVGYKYTRRNSGSDIEMVFVKGGTFKIGNDDGSGNGELPHSVTLNSFYIGKTEITQQQWNEIMGADPVAGKSCSNCPVVNVSWEDAQVFIQKLNEKTGKHYRLPTEAEWEFAAAGGSKSRGYLFSGGNKAEKTGWNCLNSAGKIRQAGQKLPNELGIFDMSGNVWEWCGDWYAADTGTGGNTACINPTGPASGTERVIRGGGVEYSPRLTTIRDRNKFYPGQRAGFIGFRLVLLP